MEKRTNKLLSFVLAISLLLSMFTVNMFVSAEELAIWDGTTKTAPTDSDGDDVYEITNAAELAYVIDNDGTIDGTPACSFILTNDIYINDPSKVNWETGVALDATYAINSWFRYWKTGSIYRSFAGTIDGDGHTVYGLYFNMTANAAAADAAALIPAVSGTATIKNLAVDKAYVNYTNGVSAFVGYALEGSIVNISNSYAGADVTLTGGYAGAFRATSKNAEGGLIDNCYSLATTVSTENSTGLVAFVWENGANKLQIRNCYNANGAITTHTQAYYYIVSENNYEILGGGLNGEGVTTLTTANMQGYDVLKNASKMPNLNAGGAFYATEGYPVLRVFLAKTNPELLKVWDGASKTKPVGEGTEDAPYLVSNGAELAWVISGCKNGESIKLTDDIYLNQLDKINWATGQANDSYIPNTWISDVDFNGNIDGDGHMVYGVYYNAGLTTDQMTEGWASPAALIPGVANGANITIQKLGVDNMLSMQIAWLLLL